MTRSGFGKRWQAGPYGGHYVGVDPKQARAALRASQPASVHRTKWLCLDCLKTMKDFHASDLEVRTCPSCAGVAKRVGVKFRPPKLTDFRGWRATISWLESGYWRDNGRLSGDDIARLRKALAKRRAAKKH